MSQFDVDKGENPRIVFLLLIALGASAVLIFGLAWRQLIAPQEFEAIEKQQTERRILNPGPYSQAFGSMPHSPPISDFSLSPSSAWVH